jgi:hypothetical protein
LTKRAKQLQLEILHQDGITEQQEATRRVFFVFFQRLVERDFRQDLVELCTKLLRVGGAAPLNVTVHLCRAQAFFKQAAVVIEHHGHVAQDSEIDTAFSQRLQEYFKSQPVTGALVRCLSCGLKLGVLRVHQSTIRVEFHFVRNGRAMA